MKKLILFLILLPMLCIAGVNPVLQNPYTTNTQSDADAHVKSFAVTNQPFYTTNFVPATNTLVGTGCVMSQYNTNFYWNSTIGAYTNSGYYVIGNIDGFAVVAGVAPFSQGMSYDYDSSEENVFIGTYFDDGGGSPTPTFAWLGVVPSIVTNWSVNAYGITGMALTQSATVATTLIGNTFSLDTTYPSYSATPRWEMVTFTDGDGLGGPIVLVGSTPTNLVCFPKRGTITGYTNIFGDNTIFRDPSAVWHNGFYWLTWSCVNNGSNCFPVAVGNNGFDWMYVTNITVTNSTTMQLRAPEWFQDTDGSLHVVYIDAITYKVWLGDVVTSPVGTMALTNTMIIADAAVGYNSDPVIYFNNGVYYLFTTMKEWSSTSLHTVFTNSLNALPGNLDQEGITVFPVNGVFYIVYMNGPSANNTPPYGKVYYTSLDLTNLSGPYTGFPLPTNVLSDNVVQYQRYDQGTMFYIPGMTNFTGTFTGDGSGLTNLNVTTATGTLPIGVLTKIGTNAYGVLVTDGAGNRSYTNAPTLNVVNMTGLPTTNSVVQTNDTRALNLTNAGNVFGGTFNGNAVGMTNLQSTNLVGSIPSALLPPVSFHQRLPLFEYQPNINVSSIANSISANFPAYLLTSGASSLRASMDYDAMANVVKQNASKTNFWVVINGWTSNTLSSAIGQQVGIRFTTNAVAGGIGSSTLDSASIGTGIGYYSTFWPSNVNTMVYSNNIPYSLATNLSGAYLYLYGLYGMMTTNIWITSITVTN